VIHVGIDIERVERFSFVQKAGGRIFRQRIYTPTERSLCEEDPLLLALCFTAKEAVAKVLGAGLHLGPPGDVHCQEIEATWGMEFNHPKVTLRGGALRKAEDLGITNLILLWRLKRGLAFSLAGGTDTAGGAAELRDSLKPSLAIVAAALDRMAARSNLEERRVCKMIPVRL
jgi:holo-[acyl-carrier protein] synthase